MILFAMMSAAPIPSSPDLVKAEGIWRPNESGAAFLVSVEGLKDRRGRLKLELYPANDADFLADDNILISEGKVFRRVEETVPSQVSVTLCIRAPGPGVYAISLMHDRDANRKFSLSIDGVGFAGNPKLGLSKPSAAKASARVGAAPAHIPIRLNYRRGLFSFGPLER